MKVVFLDFDGVVVCLPPGWREERKSRGLIDYCERGPVAELNRIIEATGAVVVVSSTWRLHHPLVHLREVLGAAGFIGKVVSKTPDLVRRAPGEALFKPTERGHEVEAWLAAHPEVESYVVLDDDSDRGPLPKERWVLVGNGWLNGGLQPEHADKAIAALRVPREVAV